MRAFASKVFKRVNLLTLSAVVAVSSLSAAVPFFVSHVADAASPAGVVTNDTTSATYTSATSIQDAINAANAGDTIEVGAGTYAQDVTINKAITLEGAGSATTSIVATDANSTPLTIATNGATVEGFTLTHDYTPTELAAWNFNNNDVTFAQNANSNTLKNSTVSLGRNGIYLNNSQNNVIDNDTVTNNRTGINLTNDVDGTQIINNTISENWTLGVVYYSQGGVTNFSTVSVTGNNFDQNWYTELEIKTAGASTGTLDVTDNTFSDSPVTISTDVSPSVYDEPSFANQRPVSLGGTATAPTTAIPTLRIYSSPSVTLNYTAAPTNLHFNYTIDGQSDNGATLPDGAVVNSNKPTTYHTGGSLNLAWTAPTGTVTGYQILVTNPDGTTQVNYQGPNPWAWLSFTQQGIYTYQVRAEDGSVLSPYSATYTITYDSIAPVVTVTPLAGSLLHGTETFHITVTDANLNPATLKHVWVYLYNNLPPQKSQGASVDLSTGSADFTVDTTKLVDGLATLDVGQIADAAGNLSGTGDSYFKNYIIDNIAPAAPHLTFPANGVHRQTSNTNHSDWSAVTDANGPVTYYYESAYDSNFTNIAYPRTSVGTNTSILNPGEPEGTYYWRVQACDAAGNCSPWSNYRSIIIDNTAPVVTVNTLWTTDSTPLLTGTVNDSTAKITVKVDGHTYNAVNHGSTWTANVTHSISDGIYNVIATATDQANNVGTDTTINELTVDAHAPKTPSLVTPFDDSYTNHAAVHFTWAPAFGLVNGPLSYHLLVTNSSHSTVVDYTGSNLFDTQSLPDGVYYARVMDTDTLGGTSQWSSVHKFTVDTVKPTVTITNPSQHAVVNGTISLTGTASDLHPDSYTWTIKNNTTHHTVYTHTSHNSTVASHDWDTTQVNDGSYTISLEATDAAGNSQTRSVEITVDNSAPTGLANLSPADGTFTTTANATSIDWTDATDAHGPVTYYYESSLSSATNADGSFVTPVYQSGALSSSTIATPNTPEGTYYWHVRAVDSLGNSTAWTDAWQLNVDDTAPTTPGIPTTTSPTNTSTVNWSWTASTDPSAPASGVDGYYYTLKQGSTVIEGPTFTTSTSATTVVPADGTYTLEVYAVDNIGNASDVATGTVTVDTTPPNLFITSASDTTVTGTVEAGITNLVVTLGSTQLSPTITGTTWTATYAPLAPGSYTITAVATDEAGNTTTEVLPLTVTAPTTPGGSATTTTGTPTTTNGTAGVLGDSTTTPSSDTDSGVKGASTTNKVADATTNHGNLFGLAWYWWLIILAAIVAIIWWIIAAARNRSAQE